MTGNLENLIRPKVTSLCPVTRYNFCLTNWHVGQGKLLPLLPQQKHWWHRRFCHLCGALYAGPVCSSWSTMSTGSHPLSWAGWQETPGALLRTVCLISSFAQFSGAGWAQYFKSLWEYSLSAVIFLSLKPSLQTISLANGEIPSSYECSASKRWGTSLISAVSPESRSPVSARCWGGEVGGAASPDPDKLPAGEGVEVCASPAAPQPFSPVPVEQSNDCSLLRDTAASPQGSRGHLKGTRGVFAPQPLQMEGLYELLEDNLITE